MSLFSTIASISSTPSAGTTTASVCAGVTTSEGITRPGATATTSTRPNQDHASAAANTAQSVQAIARPSGFGGVSTTSSAAGRNSSASRTARGGLGVGAGGAAGAGADAAPGGAPARRSGCRPDARRRCGPAGSPATSGRASAPAARPLGEHVQGDELADRQLVADHQQRASGRAPLIHALRPTASTTSSRHRCPRKRRPGTEVVGTSPWRGRRRCRLQATPGRGPPPDRGTSHHGPHAARGTDREQVSARKGRRKQIKAGGGSWTQQMRHVVGESRGTRWRRVLVHKRSGRGSPPASAILGLQDGLPLGQPRRSSGAR
jgi:hypothetical protein